MLVGLCLCAEIPQVATRHRFLLIRHRLEQWKTTNTGRLAAAALSNCQLCQYGTRTEPPTPPPQWGAPSLRYLFYPRQGGPAPRPPSELRDLEQPATIVVLDGTWSQTRKMARTIPQLAEVPTVALPAGAEPRFSLREETFGGGLATLDAISWLVEAVEGPEVADPLNELYSAFVHRVLESRGTPLDPASPLHRPEAVREDAP
ncbi:MAG TPA: hypothetical protein DIU15_15180 [Deltaproteobacteria bacterium]|nr:hypothetical protein [Deltaproteobacteria bacterium]HCP47383.1 hypothetical protein [Deltaproteobacteria bacterium]